MSIVINPLNGKSIRKASISVVSNPGTTLMCDNEIYQLSDAETQHCFLVDVKTTANQNYRNLPSGYQQLDWIENTGNAYIDYNFAFQEEWRFQTKIRFNSLSMQDIEGTSYISICGGTAAGPAIGELSYIHNYSADTTNTYIWNSVYPNNLFSWSNSFNTNTDYIITSKKDHLSLNKQRIGYDGEVSTTCSGNFCLLGSHAHAHKPFLGRLYYFKIRNQFNELIYDFVPCKRLSDNKIGLYDLIKQEFKASSTSVNFSSGSVTAQQTYHFYTIKAIKELNVVTEKIQVSSYTNYNINLDTNIQWNVFTAGSSDAGYSSGTYFKVEDDIYETIGTYKIDPYKSFSFWAKGSSNPEWYYGGSQKIYVYYNNICLKQSDGGYHEIFTGQVRNLDVYFCFKSYGYPKHIAKIFDIYDFDTGR